MNSDDLRRILTTFADTPAHIDISKGELSLQLRDETIVARLLQTGSGLAVQEFDDAPVPAHSWLITRLARLPLLADRILSAVPAEPYFVPPRGHLLDQLDTAPTQAELPVPDVLSTTIDVLKRRPAGTCSVLYLTSDAGHGKTTVIGEIARQQAAAYKARTTNWLLVPIPLGGRPFLRFDDVVVGTLLNRLRFPFLFFESFLELVRLGVLVPALDGFEEIFVEGGPGDAVSSLGNLLQSLRSEGTLLIAARRAYFEFKRLDTQARLFDSIHGHAVSFARLAIDRWSKEQFVAYAEKRSIANATSIFEKAAGLLADDAHPLLTRPVLARRLLELVSRLPDPEALLARIRAEPSSFFPTFVDEILRREATEKWLDRAGDLATPLLSPSEHYELLASLALEMWLASTEAVGADILTLVAELYCESRQTTPSIARQIVDRLPHHGLLVQATGTVGKFAFDHEHFYYFFLAYGLLNHLKAGATADVRNVLRQNMLPHLVAESVVGLIRNQRLSLPDLVGKLTQCCSADGAISYTRDNAGVLVGAILDGYAGPVQRVSQMFFPTDALLRRAIADVAFERCVFRATSLEGGQLRRCTFVDCDFESLELASDLSVADTVIRGCRIRSVIAAGRDDAVFGPTAKAELLASAGFRLEDSAPSADGESRDREPDDQLVVALRALRVFRRSTAVNQEVLRLNLGVRAGAFFADVLPTLLRHQVLVQVPYQGSGIQKRYKLGVWLQDVEEALRRSAGGFEVFCSQARELADTRRRTGGATR